MNMEVNRYCAVSFLHRLFARSHADVNWAQAGSRGTSIVRNQAPRPLVPATMKPRGPILNQPTVLLVEDEPLVRATQVDILREAGFWVLEAQDADEAFEILKQRVGVRVVLTDVDMPGSLDGFEFSRLVAQGWPEVGVLVILCQVGEMAHHPG